MESLLTPRSKKRIALETAPAWPVSVTVDSLASLDAHLATEYRPIMIILNLFIFVAVAGVLVNGCASRERFSMSHRESQSLSMSNENLQIECQLNLVVGGATSKDFERALARTYRPLNITLVAGTNAVSKVSGKDAASDYFVGGVESETGKMIVRILDEQKPWEWEGAKGTRFANNLYFNGSVRGKAWEYTAVYPDPKLESLLIRLRKQLVKGSNQNGP
jgi:hypothetical protein